MKRVISIILLMTAFCLSSFGQIFIIDKQGKVYDGAGGPLNLGEELFLYKDIIGRYPNDKDALLDFILDKDRYNSVDSVHLDYYKTQQQFYIKTIKKHRNKLTTAGDTCSFYIAKERYTIQCTGGVAQLQNYDSDMFRAWRRSNFYDKNGKYLWTLVDESPSLPSAIKDLGTRFRYVVTMEPKFHYNSEKIDFDEDEMMYEVLPSNARVFVPVTMTRSGAFRYDLSCLEGIQMYYQIYEEPLKRTSIIGPITIEDAIDPDYFDAIKVYMKSFLDQHEEVDRMELWELILFNNPPRASSAQR